MTHKNAAQVKICVPQSAAAFQATLRTRERSSALRLAAIALGDGEASVLSAIAELESMRWFISVSDQAGSTWSAPGSSRTKSFAQCNSGEIGQC